MARRLTVLLLMAISGTARTHGATALGVPTTERTEVDRGGGERLEVSIAAGLGDRFAGAAARVAPSVVAIEVDRLEDVPSPGRMPGVRGNAELEEYYRRPKGPVSGVAISRDGFIITSRYNVAGKLKAIHVILPDGSRHEATLAAVDEPDDLALLRIEAKDLPVPEWADAASVKVGRFVVAVGRSPDPARYTASVGIVGATGRNDGRAFQTDAALNYGNSGGPLVDREGRLMGIAVFVGHVYPIWGQNSGVGFGTSVETLAKVLERMKAGESIPMPDLAFLGVGGDEGAIDAGGAVLNRVLPDSAAARAGLRTGDVVLEMDGERIPSWDALRWAICRHRVGEQVEMKVRRGKEEITVTAVLGKRP